MPDEAVIRLPPLAGRQQESWRAFTELAPTLGDHCLLVGGQMVFLLEAERGSLDTRPTDDVDIVIDLRVEPAGLARVHQALIAASFDQALPSADGSLTATRVPVRRSMCWHRTGSEVEPVWRSAVAARSRRPVAARLSCV